jgi:hypothetical protein
LYNVGVSSLDERVRNITDLCSAEQLWICGR